MELKEIKELIALMRKNDLSVFKMEKEGFKITLKKGTDFQPVVSTSGCASGHRSSRVRHRRQPPSPKRRRKAQKEIVSPMVGTFYRAAIARVSALR